MHFDIWSFLLILGVGQGLTGLYFLLRKKTKPPGTWILAGLILILTAHLAEFLVLNAGYYQKWPHLMRLTEPFLFLIGPAFYFFIQRQLKPNFEFKTIDLLHALPFVLALVYVGPWFLQPAGYKLHVFDRLLRGGASGIGIKGFFYGLTHISLTLIYTFIAFRKVVKQLECAVSDKLRFLKSFSLVIMGYWWVQWAGLCFIMVIQYYIFYIDFTLALINAAFIQYLALKVSHSGLSEELTPAKKYSNSQLKPGKYEQLLRDIEAQMAAGAYLDSFLTLQRLADQLAINKSYLSQVINQEFDQGFPDYVNQYRIKHALRLLEASEYADAKLLAIALDSGFNNKTSFNRAFTRVVGLNPSEYRKQLS